MTNTADGAIVYLRASDRDASLERVAKAGGSVVMPKTDIGEPGFIALMRDTEGTWSGFTRRVERFLQTQVSEARFESIS